MADSPIATAADYADAMLTARSAKNALFLVLLVLLLLQLAIFFLYRYEIVQFTPSLVRRPAPAATTTSTTSPTTVRAVIVQQSVMELLLTYLVGLTDFLGVVLTVVLALVLLLLVNIMLVGRLIGVAGVTSAYIWTLILLVLVFPWQAFLGPYAFKLPGVLYTWDELINNARWQDLTLPEAILRWSRFVVMPLVAVIILMAIQIKSVRGIRQALGEGVDVAV
ncbi:MAG TPA: hypothetical protein VF669_12555 [Tepidisphaeraceae bacterium]|jgi:hypothetical protein